MVKINLIITMSAIELYIAKYKMFCNDIINNKKLTCENVKGVYVNLTPLWVLELKIYIIIFTVIGYSRQNIFYFQVTLK